MMAHKMKIQILFFLSLNFLPFSSQAGSANLNPDIISEGGRLYDKWSHRKISGKLFIKFDTGNPTQRCQT